MPSGRMTKAGAAAKAKGSGLRLNPGVKLSPLDAGAARAELADVAEAAEEAGLTRLAEFLVAEGEVQDFLGAVFDLSDFLRDCARRRPDMLDRLFDSTVGERSSRLPFCWPASMSIGWLRSAERAHAVGMQAPWTHASTRTAVDHLAAWRDITGRDL